MEHFQVPSDLTSAQFCVKKVTFTIGNVGDLVDLNVVVPIDSFSFVALFTHPERIGFYLNKLQ
jgi:hypothetical protein